ncbi:MAG: YqgE/AlgH family protein [Muribaculaceae bacterium]|nr:YqgE/AlgH family protein [Muribaculaceae bacterium]
MENTTENQHISDTGSAAVKGGEILLSSPLLADPNFKRTAVLILEQDNNQGHLGLILNRPLDLTLQEICDMPGMAREMKVHNGGPVDLQRIFWLHTLGDLLPGSFEVLPGLYVGGDYNTLINAFSEGKDFSGKIRFYLGYSGWTAGQLQKEIEAGAWGVLPHLLDPQRLLDSDGDEMWHFLTRQLGEEYRHWLMIPADPNMN